MKIDDRNDEANYKETLESLEILGFTIDERVFINIDLFDKNF